MKTTDSRLTQFIILMLFSGAFLGIFINLFFANTWLADYLITNVFETGSTLFLASLKMLVVPLVFVSLVCGVASLGDVKKLGSLGLRSLVLYIMTTALAISLAIIFSLLIKPGVGFDLEFNQKIELLSSPPFKQTLLNIFPSNPFKAFADGNMLQVILFAIFIGFGVLKVGKPQTYFVSLLEEINSVIMALVTFFMKLAPYGVFMVMSKVFAESGLQAFKPLLGYFVVVVMALFFHVLFTYFFMLRFLASVNPLIFFRKMKSCLALAFGTASSSMTLPMTLKSVTNNLGIDRSIASFSLSLGATINMDGTAIMQGVATVFIAQAYNIDIGLVGYLTVVIMATLASIGTAGVPGVGLITLSMVLAQVGLPVEGIGLIIGVDRLLDMFRTAVNVSGDATISCVLGRWDRKIDDRVYSEN